MRILVCGGRGFACWRSVWRTLDVLRPSLLIEGGCRTGADAHARAWGEARGAPRVRVDAEWDRYGRSAGPRRNARMLLEYSPDLVVAFPGGDGTSDMVRRAESAGVLVLVPAWRFPLG